MQLTRERTGTMSQTSSRWRITAVVLVGVFMSSLDLFIVNIAFPAIERSYHASSLSDLSWVLNAYTIVFAALLVPAGRWADRLGRRRAFLGGLALFTLSSAACAFAPSVATLVLARTFQAAGAALMLPTSLGLLLPEFPPERRAGAIGLWAAVGGVAAAFGPPLGGLLVTVNWRAVFLVNVPIGLIGLAAGHRFLREHRDASGARPDALGAALLAAAIAALAAGIVKAPAWGWTNARPIALFAAALVLLAALAARSRTHPAPVIEPELLRSRSATLANAASIVFYSGFSVMLLASVLFLTGVWHESVLTAGLQIAPGPAMAALTAFPGGLLGARYGQRAIGTLGALIFAAGALWRIRLGATPDYAGTFLPSMLLGGLGVGLILPSLSAAATADLPAHRFATGSGVLVMSRQIGSTLGVAILVALLGAAADPSFTAAWIFNAATALGAGALLAMLAPRPRPGQSPQPLLVPSGSPT
ncbi:MAG TPA: MFS transporter [Solirubrobacteraceae bacterium]|jgi:EmrB/QacA subfamily drug resistance transporter|nr:MFS transporter [Solirubrobacteraceae bacterium]